MTCRNIHYSRRQMYFLKQSYVLTTWEVWRWQISFTAVLDNHFRVMKLTCNNINIFSPSATWQTTFCFVTWLFGHCCAEHWKNSGRNNCWQCFQINDAWNTRNRVKNKPVLTCNATSHLTCKCFFITVMFSWCSWWSMIKI